MRHFGQFLELNAGTDTFIKLRKKLQFIEKCKILWII